MTNESISGQAVGPLMRDLASFRHHQVFLNYPFDTDFLPIAAALNFAVVAAGQLPVCTRSYCARRAQA